eukprot:scaffold36735_cov183-Amphora_coffeaeformis.AAC.3
MREPSIVSCSGSVVGGLDFVHGGLESFVGTLDKMTLAKFEQLTYYSGFVHALAHNGLSTQFTLDEDSTLPSTWHMDNVGGLVDFDYSIALCAFDGLDTCVTDRAALSISTLKQVVTPFVWKEERNKKRLLKYWKRGFTPFVMGPNCLHGM